MDTYWLDLRYTLRTLRANPGFAVAAVLTLMLGIGASTTIFGVVNALLLRPQPGIEAADELVAINTDEGRGFGTSSYLDFVDLRSENEAFASLAAFKPRPMDLGLGSTSERVAGLMVTAGYFETLGVEPVVGRSFLAAEDSEPNAIPVAMLSHPLWQKEFGGRRDAIGRSVRLNGREFTIVGVSPAGFRGTMLDTLPEVFVPMMMQPHFMPSSGYLLERRGWTGLWIVGRLAAGASPTRAQAHVELIAERLRQEYPATNGSRRLVLSPMNEASLPPQMRGPTVRLSVLLMVCVTLFLLIACVNVANLVLARSSRRAREVAMRQALGAGRGRIVRQLLIESAVLSSIGGVGGLLLATWSSDVFRALPLPGLDVSLDWRVLSFTLALSLLTALVFGLAPALRSSAVDLVAALKSNRRTVPARRRQRAGGSFVILQVAVSVVLLVAAGLFIRTLNNLMSTDLGMTVENVLVAKLDPALQRYDGPGIVSFYDRVLGSVEALPGVAAASVTSARPGGGEGDSFGFFLPGSEQPEGKPDGRFGFSLVGLDYFRTVAIPLRSGRAFTRDDGTDEPPAIIVNQAGAQLLQSLTGRPALGAQLSVDGPDGPWSQVVGVVSDSKTGSLRSEAEPFAYGAHSQLAPRGFDWPMSLVVRTEVPPMSLLPAVRGVIRDIDPYLPITNVTTLESYLFGEALVMERVSAWALGLSAVMALLLAAVGLFGVMSYSVSSRVRELGIRRALGAGSGELLRMVLRQGMKLVGVGLALGVAAAMAAGRALSSFLYGLSGSDPLTILSVVVLLTTVALFACWLPARCAARVDPMATLRID